MTTMTRDWRAILERCWDAATSATPDWPEGPPSQGQCAVTALVIQDYEGGILLRQRTMSGSHYFNRLADGTEVDLTRDQFGPNEEFGPPSERTRAYVLSYPSTVARYQLLRERVARELGA